MNNNEGVYERVPVPRDVIGKYVVYYNGGFAPRRDLEIIDVSDSGDYITFKWDEKLYTEHKMKFEAIIDNVGDDY
jgi:hypothetical protein